MGIQKFHRYLYGTAFTIETDHQPLSYLNKAKLTNSTLMRWALALQPYRFRIVAIRGAENVCSLAQSIDVNLKLEDIDRSHRIGKPVSIEDGRKPRDIIVKFVSYRKRAQFYKARVLTKSRGYRGVFINEHLTKARAKLLYEARRRVTSKQIKSAWSTDGSVFIKLKDTNPESNFDGTVKRITSVSDLPAFVPLPGQER